MVYQSTRVRVENRGVVVVWNQAVVRVAVGPVFGRVAKTVGAGPRSRPFISVPITTGQQPLVVLQDRLFNDGAPLGGGCQKVKCKHPVALFVCIAARYFGRLQAVPADVQDSVLRPLSIAGASLQAAIS